MYVVHGRNIKLSTSTCDCTVVLLLRDPLVSDLPSFQTSLQRHRHVLHSFVSSVSNHLTNVTSDHLIISK